MITHALLLKLTGIIATWLKDIAKNFDAQPDKNEVHIPFGFRRSLYQTFLEFWIDEVEDGITGDPIAPPTEWWFNEVWKRDVGWLKCRAYHRFMMCDACNSFNERLANTKDQ